VISVPSYSIHRDPGVWGEDVEEFRPERWFEKERQDDIQRTFNPFSYGPRYRTAEFAYDVTCLSHPCRGCVGRNLASMELLIILSSVFRRFDIVLEHPEETVSTCLSLKFICLMLFFSLRHARASCASQ
jgi:benzoate 4-monooxygenase